GPASRRHARGRRGGLRDGNGRGRGAARRRRGFHRGRARRRPRRRRPRASFAPSADESPEKRRLRHVAPGGDGRLGARPPGRPRPAPRHPRSGRAHGAGARAHPRLEARVSGLTVHGAGPADRDAIQAVTLAAYQEYAATIAAHWDGYRQNIIATLAAAAPGTQIVALDGDRVVGAVLLYPAGASLGVRGGAPVTLTVPEVRLLAVAPSARGRGV